MFQTHQGSFGYATNFRDQARAMFGPPGPQNQNIPASVETPATLALQAVVLNDNIAKKSLQGLSPCKIDDGTTVNVSASSQYWVDRVLMTEARLLFDARDLISYDGTVVSSSFIDSVEFMDMQSNMSLKVYNGKQIPPEFKKIQFGSDNADSLSGGNFADNLYGLNGSDFLVGGLGNDFLAGGEGFDSYEINSGRDTIFDSDGQGSVELNGEILIGGDRIGGSVWDSTDGRFRYQLVNTFQGSQLFVNDLVPGGGSLLVNGFSSGDLGIDLSNSNNPLPPIDTTAPIDSATIGTLDNYDTGSSGNDYYDAGNLYDVVSDYQGGHDVVLLGSDGGFSDRAATAFGNDTIYGEEGNDYIVAGVGFNNAVNGPVDKDTVIGGADVDLISTGVGDDVIIAGEEGENINATNTSDQGDWIVADEGNDLVYGTGNQDFITLGTGADVVYAGGGFDVILADGYYRFNQSVAVINDINYGSREHQWNGSSWDTTSVNFALLTPGSAFDFTTSIDSGGDFVFTPLAALPDADRVQTEVSDSNDDIVFAGPGPDWISGGPGSDTLRGEADDDIIYGDDLVAMPAGAVYGDDTLFGGSGDDLLFGNQGNDVLSGGLGDDMLMGDDMGEPSGNDSLFGGDGVDELYGFGGDDYLSGGTGNETVLMGGDGNDTIDGNHGDDVLTGGSGNDNLHGGQGNDLLDGGDDNDFLNGGDGDDTLNGGAGNDTLFSTNGLNQLNGDAGDDVYVVALNNSPSESPDVISDSGGYDKIQFDEMVFSNRIEFTDQGGDLLVQYSPKDAVLVSGGAGGAVIEEYEFFDGRVLTYGDLNSVVKVSRGSSNEISAFDDWYEGDATIQNLDMLAGNDAAFGYEGNDILTGGAGNDLLDGGVDNDTLNGGVGNDRLFGATGDDQLFGGADEDLLAAGDGADTLDGGAGIDVLAGGFGDDLLVGGDGNDYLQGDDGADTLEGGLGFDTYVFKSGDDPEPGIIPKTSIVDTNDAGGNAIMFIGGLDSADITLINDLDTGDLEIQYAYQGNSLVSTIYVANSAEGEVVSEFQFDDGTTITFEDLCLSQPATCEVDDLIFENGFEQAQLLTDIVSADYLSPDPYLAISLILSLTYQKLFA
ncbi:MAG: calcium-binding protein [Proteobacteria bacterium]|nr:MAG: calcium-binding protein [Pseudomonadota bacterium]